MIIFTVIGVLFVVSILAAIVGACSEFGSIGEGDGFICTVLGIGFIYAKDDTILNSNCNRLRNTQGKNLFINAPAWFNRYVYNVGGVKK